jgi:hypothetical protein
MIPPVPYLLKRQHNGRIERKIMHFGKRLKREGLFFEASRRWKEDREHEAGSEKAFTTLQQIVQHQRKANNNREEAFTSYYTNIYTKGYG